MRLQIAVPALSAVLASVLASGGIGPAHAQVTPSIEAMDAAVLSLDEIRIASGAQASLSLFENPSFPNRCIERVPGRMTCSRNMGSPPTGSAYPFWLHMEAFGKPADAEWEFKLVKSYRPRQTGVVGVPRDEGEMFSVAYVHTWDSESVFTMQRRGPYLVSVSCAARKGESTLAKLQACSESLAATQMQRMEAVLGQGLRAPGQPTNVNSSLDGSTALITWSTPTSDGGSPIVKYQVRATDGSVVCETGPTSSGLNECRADVSNPKGEIAFNVVALNAVGAGPASQSTVPVIIERRINPPRTVRVESKGTAAVVSWQPSTQTGGSAPTVFTATVLPGGASCTTRRSQCTVKSLEPGGTFVVRVTASQGSAVSRPSQSKKFRTRPLPAPSRPSVPEPPTPAPQPPKQELQIS